MRTKLILVEGVPGSGKTSTAKYIKQMLDRNHITNQLFLEGDVDHPADYESISCLPQEKYAVIMQQYPQFAEKIEQYSIDKSDCKLVQYRKLHQDTEAGVCQELIDALSSLDVYQLPATEYQKRILERWTEFVSQAQESEDIVILECCYIQNPMTTLLVRSNEPQQNILNFIQQLTQIIQPLNPRLLYFHQGNVRTTLERVIQERPKEWLEFITWYYTKQGYGLEQGLQGLDGLIAVMEHRRTLELSIINQLQMNKLIIDNTGFNWEIVHHKIHQFLNLQ